MNSAGRSLTPSDFYAAVLVTAAVLALFLFAITREGLGAIKSAPKGAAPQAMAGVSDPKAQYEIAVSIAKGSVTKDDDVLAAQWMRLSADQGYAPAQNQLGWMYENGLGVRADGAAAAHWYGAAAKAGYTDALYNLDWLYLQGRAIHTDATEARSWYRSRNFR